MRFILNGRFYTQPITGVQRYARSLVEAGLGLDPDEARVALPGVGLVPIDEAAVTPIPNGRAAKKHIWEQVVLPSSLERGDLLVGLCNGGPIALKRQVMTIHDATPAIVPQTFSFLHHQLFRLSLAAARRGRRVITISERSKVDLTAHYGIKPDLIDVVSPGVDNRFTPGPVDVRQPYCLFVGAHDPRKNLAYLEKLWPEVKRRTGLELVATGRATSHAHAAADQTDVSVLTDVSDDELIDLYRGATLVLHPSLAEGFGLPILEGAACGTPFLSTDVGAAMEMAFDADRQILPLRPPLWVEAIVAYSEMSADARAAASAGSVGVARRFTWERGAAQLGEALRRAAGERP